MDSAAAGAIGGATVPKGNWQGGELVDFESFLDDYLATTHQQGGAPPGESQLAFMQHTQQQRQKLSHPNTGQSSQPGGPGAAHGSSEGLLHQAAQQARAAADLTGSRAGSGDAAHTTLRSSSGDSPGPSSPPRRSGGKSSAAKRTLELQEKNRRAQRRFRERQKAKVTELEDQVSELSQRINGLTSEKANLESRVNILVRVLRMRDDEIAQLQQKVKAAPVQAGSAAAESEVVAGMEDLRLTAQSGEELTLTPGQLRSLTRDQLVRIWKGYVNQLAMLLVDLEKGNTAAGNTIKKYIEEVSLLSMRMHLINPTTVRQFISERLEDSAEAPCQVETAERWLNIARSLGLSPAQKTEIIQLRRLFLSKMNAIMQQRREIHQNLMSAMPSPSFSRATAIQSLRSHDSMERLRGNLKEEHILKMDWILTLFKHTLAPPQVARMLVQAWPWSPDTLAMATWVAAEAGEPDALTTLTQASRGLLAAQVPQLSAPPGPEPAPLCQPMQQPMSEGFTPAFSAGSSVPMVKAEPVPGCMWPQRVSPADQQGFGSSDGLGMRGQGVVGSFDLATGLDDFDAALPLDALDSPAAPSF